MRPSIPSGFSAKLMIGRVLTSLSRTTAKCPESASASSRLTGPIARAWPRWAICRVISWNASRPSSVKSKVTFGSLLGSSVCFGLVMSVPRERRVVLERVPARLGVLDRAGRFVGRLFGDDDRPRRDLRRRSRPSGSFLPGRADEEVFLGNSGPAISSCGSVFLEQVVARLGGRAVRRSLGRFLFGGELRRFVGGRVGAGDDQLLVFGFFGVAAGFFPSFFASLSAASGGSRPGWPPIAFSRPIRFGSQS